MWNPYLSTHWATVRGGLVCMSKMKEVFDIISDTHWTMCRSYEYKDLMPEEVAEKLKEAIDAFEKYIISTPEQP